MATATMLAATTAPNAARCRCNMEFPRKINSNPAELFPICEAAPLRKTNWERPLSAQPLRASSQAHMLHPQCGHDTALAWRDYRICGENGGGGVFGAANAIMWVGGVYQE